MAGRHASGRKPVRFRVVPSEEGMMLGHLLARRLPNVDVDQGRELVKAGAVYMGHVRIRVPTVRVVAGELITVYPQALEDAPLPDHAVRFVHRDPAFVVLDKPPGIAVAATRQSARGTLSEALRRTLEREGLVRPYVGVVHRLDQGASGLVLFTIRSIANQSMHRQFARHDIERAYRLRVHGDAPREASCDAPLLVGRTGTVRVAEPGDPRARPAHTDFRRLEPHLEMPDTSLLEARLATGRTHQIRVHAKTLGHPIVGDHRYGPDETDGEAEQMRLHLHAHRLRFEHPIDGTPVDVRSTLPPWARSTEDPPDADDPG
jgi:RluA family pseudouridine synthase